MSAAALLPSPCLLMPLSDYALLKIIFSITLFTGDISHAAIALQTLTAADADTAIIISMAVDTLSPRYASFRAVAVF
jgi:hypothetical protein